MEQNNIEKDAKLISNRFGKFEINSKKKIYFPNGLMKNTIAMPIHTPKNKFLLL